MRRDWLIGVWVIVAWLLSGTAAQAQTHIPFGNTTATFNWDAPANEQDPTILVTHYETQQDGGAWADTGLAVGKTTYSWVIPQALKTVGTHTLSVRACRRTAPAACGGPLTVQYIQDPQMGTPGLPTNPRVVVPPGAIGIAVNGTIDRPPFKEKGLDVVSILPEDGIGQILIGAQGLRDTSGGFLVRAGDKAGVVVYRDAPQADLVALSEPVTAVNPE